MEGVIYMTFKELLELHAENRAGKLTPVQLNWKLVRYGSSMEYYKANEELLDEFVERIDKSYRKEQRRLFWRPIKKVCWLGLLYFLGYSLGFTLIFLIGMWWKS
jgi:hypothetical protein